MSQRSEPLPSIRACAGQVPLKNIEQQVCNAMVDEALAQARGSRHRAAKLLDISRQRLQHILKGRE